MFGALFQLGMAVVLTIVSAVFDGGADIGFDWLYRCGLPQTVDCLARHDGNVEAFVRSVGEATKISGSEMHALMMLAMAGFVLWLTCWAYGRYDLLEENPI